jgi:UDP:flavonoid glycosyltransferase YjiC (YdhE family)
MWAARVKEVGAGDWLSFWKATPEKVGSLIRRVVGSAPLHQGASEMARAMVDEDGTGIATNRLERLMAG